MCFWFSNSHKNLIGRGGIGFIIETTDDRCISKPVQYIPGELTDSTSRIKKFFVNRFIANKNVAYVYMCVTQKFHIYV